MSQRIQIVCAWAGPAVVVITLCGWLIAGVLPIPLGFASTTREVVSFCYHDTRVIAGLIIAQLGVSLIFPVVPYSSDRIRFSSSAVHQLASQTAGVVCVLRVTKGRAPADRCRPLGRAVINHVAMHCLVPQLPFGGVGAIGMGAYHGRWGFEALSHRRAVLAKPAKPNPRLVYPPTPTERSKSCGSCSDDNSGGPQQVFGHQPVRGCSSGDIRGRSRRAVPCHRQGPCRQRPQCRAGSSIGLPDGSHFDRGLTIESAVDEFATAASISRIQEPL